MPLILGLAEMELVGFQFDIDKLIEIKKRLDTVQSELCEKAYSFAQYKFSLASTAAVSKVMNLPNVEVLCLLELFLKILRTALFLYVELMGLSYRSFIMISNWESPTQQEDKGLVRVKKPYRNWR